MSAKFQELVRQVTAMTAAADAPTTEDRTGEYKRIYGVVLGYYYSGAITAGQMLQFNRDIADQFYMYDEADIAERKKAQEEADKDAFLSGE